MTVATGMHYDVGGDLEWVESGCTLFMLQMHSTFQCLQIVLMFR